jgi:acetyl esterase/lipase
LTRDHAFLRTEPGYTKHTDIVYRIIEGEKLTCDVFVPNGRGPFPTILAVHGGAWRFGSKWQLIRQARSFAGSGFVVVAINYRLAPQWKFPAQLEDCAAAAQWINDHAAEYSIDTANLFGFGYSAGAHLISLLAVSADQAAGGPEPTVGTHGANWRNEKSSRVDSPPIPAIRAVVAGGAPLDFLWVEPNSDTLAYWLGDSPVGDPETYAAASATAKVTVDSPPFFLFHADQDLVVPIECARRMQAALARCRVRCDLYVVPQSNHLTAFNDDEALRRAIEFFRGQIR